MESGEVKLWPLHEMLMCGRDLRSDTDQASWGLDRYEAARLPGVLTSISIPYSLHSYSEFANPGVTTVYARQSISHLTRTRSAVCLVQRPEHGQSVGKHDGRDK